ncbi:MAG: hypothetical protein H0T42_33485 [Deltaproteobacteria bacterium]|nr:hypothetical protein [Deltaproteobacteria bacterium]
MLTAILPVISLSVSGAGPVGPAEEVVASPRAAQVRLAEALAEADAVHGVGAVSVKRHAIAFALDRDGQAFRAVARTRASGEVISLTITPAGPAHGDLGSLSWLSSELEQTTAIMRLTVDAMVRSRSSRATRAATWRSRVAARVATSPSKRSGPPRGIPTNRELRLMRRRTTGVRHDPARGWGSSRRGHSAGSWSR